MGKENDKTNAYPYIIHDNLYGDIRLTPQEYAVYCSPLFQRLSRIRQMGMAYLKRPSATHTRLNHSLGVLYLMDRILTAVNGNGIKISEPDRRTARMAALLHDIGHLPLSHIGERALTREWESRNNGRHEWDKPHEQISSLIVMKDRFLKHVFNDMLSGGKSENCLDRVRIASIILGQAPDGDDVSSIADHIACIALHSELDADRLDFLVRDAVITGVSYGHVEVEQIIRSLMVERLQLDGAESVPIPRLMVQNKWLHDVEHYVMSNFFQNVQMLLDSDVYLADRLGEDVLIYLIKQPDNRFPPIDDLKSIISNLGPEDTNERKKAEHWWYTYTDDLVFIRMREAHDDLNGKHSCATINDYEAYINDAIKILLTGRIPSPLIERHVVISPDKTRRSEEHSTEPNRPTAASANSDVTPTAEDEWKRLLKRVLEDDMDTHNMHTINNDTLHIREEIASVLEVPANRVLIGLRNKKVTKYERESPFEYNKEAIIILVDTDKHPIEGVSERLSYKCDFLGHMKRTLIGFLCGTKLQALYVHVVPVMNDENRDETMVEIMKTPQENFGKIKGKYLSLIDPIFSGEQDPEIVKVIPRTKEK